MKTSVIYIIGSTVISAALLWSCVKTEIINRTQEEDSKDPTEEFPENQPEDTTRSDITAEPEDTTLHEISFGATVSDWVEA